MLNFVMKMEKLAKVKREEFEREEAALVPMRHYLMAHVVPVLTKGLIEVTRARPDDPVEYLVRCDCTQHFYSPWPVCKSKSIHNRVVLNFVTCQQVWLNY